MRLATTVTCASLENLQMFFYLKVKTHCFANAKDKQWFFYSMKRAHVFLPRSRPPGKGDWLVVKRYCEILLERSVASFFLRATIICLSHTYSGSRLLSKVRKPLAFIPPFQGQSPPDEVVEIPWMRRFYLHIPYTLSLNFL